MALAESWRLLLLYRNEALPEPGQILATLACCDHGEVYRAERGVFGEAAKALNIDPLSLNLRGRIAIDVSSDTPHSAITQIAQALGGTAYLCRGREPLKLGLEVGETFQGSLQLACLRRRDGLSDEAFQQRWFDDHTQIAIDTQGTLGYRQNWVHWSSGAHWDGLVEEYFPPEAATSPEHFFGAVGNPAAMQENIGTLMGSCARFLDLDQTTAMHFTDTRLH